MPRKHDRREALRSKLADAIAPPAPALLRPQALSARAAKQQRQLPLPAQPAPRDPAIYPESVAELGRINDARLTDVHRAPVRAAHLAHGPQSNLGSAPPRAWEATLLAQVEATADLLCKSRVHNDDGESPVAKLATQQSEQRQLASAFEQRRQHDGPRQAWSVQAEEEAEAPRDDEAPGGDAAVGDGGALGLSAEACWGCGSTAPLKAAAEASGGGAAPVPRPIRQLQQLTAKHLEEVQRAVRRQRARELFCERRWWYKPVARRGNKFYSLAGGKGEPVEFVLGKRMLAEHSSGPRKAGFLVYDCAARALLEAMCAITSNPLRESGRRLGCGSVAVLRVRAKRPCAPKHESWPTKQGVWAFAVLHPVGVALEKQEWMNYDKCCERWLPTTVPGLCRACALEERTCVQARNAAPVGEPPAHPSVAAAARAVAAKAAEERMEPPPKSLDHRCYA